jgi:hypothetical protein
MNKNKMQKKKFSYSNLFCFATIIFIGVIGYLLILGLMQVFGWTYPSKGLIISWVALGVFCFAIIFSFVKHKFTYKKIGTYAMHLSMILVLVGMFMYYVGGTSYKVYVKLSTPSDMVLYDKVGEYSFKNGIAEQDKYGNYIYSRSEKVNFELTAEQIKAVDFATKKAIELNNEELNYNLMLETRLWNKTKTFSGQADVVWLYDNRAIIIDYKFGRGDVAKATGNWQLATVGVPGRRFRALPSLPPLPGEVPRQGRRGRSLTV